MNVGAVAERALQRRDVGHVREQAQFDLGIVEREKLLALLGHERATDLASFLRADRDVLQIRVGRGQAAGVGDRHRIGRMDPAGVGIDLAHECVGIGALQLRQLAPVEHACGQLVATVGQIFQHIGAGRIGASLRTFPAAL